MTDSVTVQEMPTLTISAVDGNNVINHAEAAAGVTILGNLDRPRLRRDLQCHADRRNLLEGLYRDGRSRRRLDGGVPSADATALANGTATLSAQATDAYGNTSAVVTDSVTVQGNLPSLTISAVDGDNIINHAEAAAGVTISGGSTGLLSGATFTVTITDGSVTQTTTATVGASGAWTATISVATAQSLANGTATLSAQATDAYGNPSAVVTDSVTVQETVPTLTISAVDGNNVINHAEAARASRSREPRPASPPARPSMSR